MVRLFLDDGYLALVTIFGVSGIVGITATANIKPNLMSTLTCNCVPSTLIRFQELCVVLLVAAVVLVPIGMIRSKGEEGKRSQLPEEFRGVLPSGREYEGSPIRNGGVLVLGVALAVLGVGVVAPSVLVLKNPLTLAEGVVMILLGIFFVYRGGRPS
jgi:hypothetical protein